MVPVFSIFRPNCICQEIQKYLILQQDCDMLLL